MAHSDNDINQISAKHFVSRVIKFISPFKWILAFSIFLSFLFSVLSTISVSMIKPVSSIIFKVDNQTVQTAAEKSFNLERAFSNLVMSFIQSPTMPESMLKLGVMIILVFLFKNIFKYWNSIVSVKLEEGLIKSIREQVFNKLTSLSLDFFNRSRQGSLISIITNDVSIVNSTTISAFSVVLRDAAQVIIFIVVLCSISIKLTLISFSTSIISLIIIRFARTHLRKYASRMQNAMAGYTGTLSEIISGIKAVKAYNAEPVANARFALDSSRYVKSAVKNKKIVTLIPAISEVSAIFALTVVLFVGGTQVYDGVMKPDTLLLFLVTLFSIMSPIQAVLNQFVQFPRGIVAASRVFNILDMEPSVSSGTDIISNYGESIKVNDVSFKYENDLVLKNVSFDIKRGKKTAFVGSSGSGKSTMLDLIIRFYDPTNGAIEAGGKNIREYKISSYRSLFGIVTQENVLFNDTVANNIRFGDADASMEQIIEAAKLSNAYNFISKLPNGFETMLGDRGVNISGGERQRVAIARALLRNPEIIVFDEATSALDAESEKIVQEAINESLKNRTAVIVAHRLSTIINCDEILVFDKGRIAERGNHKELIAMNGLYKKLYEIQYGENAE